MVNERTYIMVKPDGVQRGLIGETVKRFEQRGLKLVAAKLFQPSYDLVADHYVEHKDQSFFDELCEFIARGPVFCMIWEGPDAIKLGRLMLGGTHPLQSAPGTLRGDFCLASNRNVVHASSSPSDAERECKLWFKDEEIVSSAAIGRDANEHHNAAGSSGQGVHHVVDFELAQVGVRLARAHEHDGLTRYVAHGQRRPDLVVDGVELGQDNAVDAPATLRGVGLPHLLDGLVELAQLVDGVVPHQRLADEEQQVGVVDVDQLGQRRHQRLVVLHAAGRVDQHGVEAVGAGVLQPLAADGRGVLAVAPLKQLHAQLVGVDFQLLHRAGTERVARYQ
ncbi:nucleoside diphosphate kinase [Babesia caballi]|uniref:nucleoside-diphosphate kinase n=1 Tax=Babesia caballi TaxID=5871 RepID=A0AAV4LLT9_BABCB|nr:nucleoside diphosphate kinase [Babesia caballi]